MNRDLTAERLLHYMKGAKGLVLAGEAPFPMNLEPGERILCWYKNSADGPPELAFTDLALHFPPGLSVRRMRYDELTSWEIEERWKSTGQVAISSKAGRVVLTLQAPGARANDVGGFVRFIRLAIETRCWDGLNG
jgi:hypothetical protein